jgi:GNAT superfamily N-acetyltransferase
MHHVSVTSALVEDTDAIRSFMLRVIATSLNASPEVRQAMVDNVNKNVDIWLARPETCVHLKALDEGVLVGVILVKDYWNLCSLFVEPSVHRKGIGRSLVEQAAALCQGRSPKDALILNAATNAISFYKRLGFVSRQSQQELPPGFMAMQRALPAASAP